MIPAKAVVFVACAAIAYAIPLPPSFFDSDFELGLFRIVIVAAAAMVLARDDYGLFSDVTEADLKPENIQTACDNNAVGAENSVNATKIVPISKMKILYGSTTGNAKSLALALRKSVNAHTRKTTARVMNLKDYEPEDLVKEECVAVICSTWNGGEPPKDAVFFDKFLSDAVLDFRRSKTMLNGLRICVYGLGSSAYPDKVFCTASKRMHESLLDLGATAFTDIGFGDDAQGDMDAEFALWVQNGVLPFFPGATHVAPGCSTTKSSSSDAFDSNKLTGQDDKVLSKRQARKLRQQRNLKRYGPSKTRLARERRKKEKLKPVPLEEEDKVNDTYLSLPELQAQGKVSTSDSGVLDIEAIGGALHAQKVDAEAQKNKPAREMVTARQRQALTKEGYKIIGTHSAVKLCRWTKHQLRGRGGCYKHTCYGITSYQCMEATPSLACANKCTFCWRHHKNPVGTEWRWKMDPPREIVKTAIKLHQNMIREYSGVPGVKPERLQEAFTVRHCALSLVGEPIMYPRINELVGELHKRNVSTFLVTNAQFPDCIKQLSPVTQLYVSIDAATPDSLKAVDRPLFADYWERFIASLEALREKRQRTVYRLTLLKGENMDGIEHYAELIAMGQPDFVEIKSVTFCGDSAATDLSHSNVPFHSEVLEFSTKLSELVNELYAKRAAESSVKGSPDEKIDDIHDCDGELIAYGVACEHHHSNLVLLAQKKI
jgi:tRNA wybutosine-synthesizing protein 1